MAEVVSFRLNSQHRRKLSKLSEVWNCTQTEVVRRLLEEAKVDDVIRTRLDGEDDSSSADREKLIKELHELHLNALQREAAKKGKKL